MMNDMLNCGPEAWHMIVGGVAIFSVLALGAAALVKYLFFTRQAGTAS